jgi:hypothetical protein
MRAKAPACQGAVEHALDGNGINLSKVKNLGWKTDYVASEGGGA